MRSKLSPSSSHAWTVGTLVALAVLIATVPLAFARGQAHDRRARWEYATLVRQHQPGQRGERWSFASGEQRINAAPLDELYQKFRVDNPETASEVSVLNKLGEDGWELVSHAAVSVDAEEAGPAGVMERFLFKRGR
ncbi:MAG: hypothetical protein ACKVS9_18095 [Phycisphaerae bacterium]